MLSQRPRLVVSGVVRRHLCTTVTDTKASSKDSKETKESKEGWGQEDGVKPVDFGERLEVCAKCEHSRTFMRGFPTICAQCGCSISAKAFFEHLHCPIGKW